jgi:hypothetical protein
MSANGSVIMLEFNELTLPLISRFMEEGKLPNFQRLYRESQVFTTDAEEDPPNLNPWVQWVTVHCGLPFNEHNIFYLDDGHKLKEKCLWDIVSDSGYPVWVCGSMNVRYDAPLNGALIPDPWSSGSMPSPSELVTYYRFVRHHVQEHTNDQASLPLSDYIRFLLFMAGHGLSLSTASAIGRQLLEELSGKSRWKRAAIMDKLQWDLFAWYYRRLRPRFATFFLNSVAHLQHCYWREMEPWHFKVKPNQEEVADHESAILYGYQEMDKLVGRFMELAGENTTLVFCTALSQQPCLAYEEEGGKCFYRPRHFEDVMKLAGVGGNYSVSPVMSEEFQLRFESEQDARNAVSLLRTLHVDSLPLLRIDLRGREVYTGCSIHGQVEPGAFISRGTEPRSPFFKILYQSEGLKSGMHHREGLLWIRRPDRTHGVHSKKVSITAIAPTVLSLLQVRRPGSMKSEPLLSA